MINETFARMYWPGASPLGARIRFGGATAPWRTVVGVVRDVRERGFDLSSKPGAYVVYSQLGNAWTPEQLVVRASGDLSALVGPIREIVAEVDREQPIAAVRTMEEIIDQAIVGRRQQMTLLAAFAGLALLLASVGLYGVLSYAVTRRRREIGVRLALGASRAGVVSMIVRHGLLLTGAGLAAGFVLAWVVTRTMTTMLYERRRHGSADLCGRVRRAHRRRGSGVCPPGAARVALGPDGSIKTGVGCRKWDPDTLLMWFW